jgi:ABC-2 type transport system permease protein
MAAVMGGGARIAAERSIGWNRHLRVSSLPVRAYFAAKAGTGYVLALITMAVLCTAAGSFGVRLSGQQWLTMTGLILIGLVPFTVLGILIGHLVKRRRDRTGHRRTHRAVRPAGRVLGPGHRKRRAARHHLAIPSYWLVQAAKSTVDGGGWPMRAWLVIAVWTLVLIPLAARAYLRDTGRA